jgi:hypothetical protein
VVQTPTAAAFVVISSRDERHNKVESRWKLRFQLRMGLYDQPLPPRPPPRKNPDKSRRDVESDDQEEADDEFNSETGEASQFNLFQFDLRGREVNGLLPNLSRRLDSGVGCYFEAEDRLVQNLVGKTSCSIHDACWALEACKGDITEAWTRISVARRQGLESKRLGGEDDDKVVDSDVLELEVEEEFQELKQRRLEDQRRRDVQDFFKGGEKDEDWLPRQTKGSFDDEPWFTG